MKDQAVLEVQYDTSSHARGFALDTPPLKLRRDLAEVGRVARSAFAESFGETLA